MENKKLEFKDFKNLFDYMVHNGIITIENGKLLEPEDALVSSTLRFFVYCGCVDEENLEGYFVHHTWQYPEFAMMEYWLLYKHIHHVEPFDLIGYLDNLIEVGGRYGWHGNPFNLLIDKKIEGKKITVKYIYFNTNAGGFKSYNNVEEEIFDIDDTDFTKFEENASNLSHRFRNKNVSSENSVTHIKESIKESINLEKEILRTLNKVFPKD